MYIYVHMYNVQQRDEEIDFGYTSLYLTECYTHRTFIRTLEQQKTLATSGPNLPEVSEYTGRALWDAGEGGKGSARSHKLESA